MDAIRIRLRAAANTSQAADAVAARHYTRAALHLVGCLLILAALAVLCGLRRLAVVVAVLLVELRADRPDAYRRARTDEAARAADGDPRQILQADGIHLDIVRGRNLGAR